jgi:hypothetical protein
MSNYDRNAYAPYGGVATQAQIDQGLRSYMLGVYNNMVIGLAITGLAALGFYMLSVTTDPSLAAGKLRNGMMLTQFGATMYTSAAEVGGDVRPARRGDVSWLQDPVDVGHCGARHLLALFGAGRRLAGDHLLRLHPHLDRARVLHHGGLLRCAEPLWLHDQEGPERAWARS